MDARATEGDEDSLIDDPDVCLCGVHHPVLRRSLTALPQDADDDTDTDDDDSDEEYVPDGDDNVSGGNDNDSDEDDSDDNDDSENEESVETETKKYDTASDSLYTTDSSSLSPSSSSEDARSVKRPRVDHPVPGASIAPVTSVDEVLAVLYRKT